MNDLDLRWGQSCAREVFLRSIGEPDDVGIISESNNTAWKVSRDSQVFVIKEISDPTVDVDSEARLLSLIGDSKLFRPILHHESVPSSGVRVAVYPYYEGRSLDLIDFRSAKKTQVEKWSEQLYESFEAIRGIEDVVGFGRKSIDKQPGFRTWMSFVKWYINNQAQKGPLMARMRFSALDNAFSRYGERIDGVCRNPMLICGDVNLRNYLVDSSDNLVCIHTPMLWHGDPAVPYGDAAVHLDSSELGRSLLNMSGYPEYRTHLYAAFSAFAILVFIERFNDVSLDEAIGWGGVRPLLDIFDEHIDLLG